MNICLDRFAYGPPDPQEAEVLAECDQCGGEIYEENEVHTFESYVFCSEHCLFNYLKSDGIVRVQSIEEALGRV